VAERSTTAVSVANKSGQPPLTAQADSATADDSRDLGEENDDTSGRTAPGRTARLEATGMAEKADETDRAERDGASGRSKDTKSKRADESDNDTKSPAPTAEADADEDALKATSPSKAACDDAEDQTVTEGAGSSAADLETAKKPGAPELHSGHKLARRYRLEECLGRGNGFSSWRAVDEKLRRAVGIHVLPADHSRARPVLAAARSAALLGDPRFVQVLDAVEENDLVYVIHEWLPDATDLTAVLTAGPLEPHDAYQMISQVSQAMAAAHREGLSHLRLAPGCVLRTESGQYRIRGLAVEAALHGLRSDHPQRDDTEAIGGVLYAALTQRWPHPDDDHGLPGLPKDVGLLAPDKVRAGVHRGLSALAMRALMRDGSGYGEPFTTPDELAKGVAAMPVIRPPEPTFPQHAPYRSAASRQNQAPPNAPRSVMAAPPPPALPSRTGKVLKWSFSALLIAALGLGSWQLANTLLNRDMGADGNASAQQHPGDKSTGSKAALKTLPIEDGREYYPFGGPQHPDQAKYTYDNNPSTYWRTNSFTDGPAFAPSIKKGVGLVYDLGAEQKISQATIRLYYGGPYTAVALYAADSLSSSTPLSDLQQLATTKTNGKTATLTLDKPVSSRYVVIWLTALPFSEADGYYGRGYKQAITDVTFSSQ
jgi:hypothetical protein